MQIDWLTNFFSILAAVAAAVAAAAAQGGLPLTELPLGDSLQMVRVPSEEPSSSPLRLLLSRFKFFIVFSALLCVTCVCDAVWTATCQTGVCTKSPAPN